ncbi:MAG: hypothetical protein WAV98_00710 [Minisyncoccia bacterium]
MVAVPISISTPISISWLSPFTVYQLGKENRAHLQNLGQDKTDRYEDEYAYSKKLNTCLYYKRQTPFMYDVKEEVAILNAEIIDASTNKKIVSLIKALNPEILETFEETTFCSSSEEWSCKTESDFYRIKNELFK